IIANTPSSADTRHSGGKDSYYDYRRATLKQITKRSIQQSGQQTRSTSQGREDAIQFAIELFKRQLKGRKKTTPPVLELNPTRYEELLRDAFDIADRMHVRLLAR